MISCVRCIVWVSVSGWHAASSTSMSQAKSAQTISSNRDREIDGAIESMRTITKNRTMQQKARVYSVQTQGQSCFLLFEKKKNKQEE